MSKRGQKGGRGSRLEKKKRGGEGWANDLHYTSKYLMSAVKIEVEREGNDWRRIHRKRDRKAKERTLTSLMCLLDSFLSPQHQTIDVECTSAPLQTQLL